MWMNDWLNVGDKVIGQDNDKFLKVGLFNLFRAFSVDWSFNEVEL